MTTLTEQWKQGKLPFGAYYVNRLEEHRIWLYQERAQTPDKCYEIYEILDEVPSYDELNTLKKFMVSGINATNRIHKLEKLLKKCRFVVDYAGTFWKSEFGYCKGLLTQIDQVLKENE